MRSITILFTALVLMSSLAYAQPPNEPPNEPPPLTDAPGSSRTLGRVAQDDVTDGSMSLRDIRLLGRTVFSTPFTRADGYGDGSMNLADPTSPGGRPTMADNGTFLRINGLDSQSCLECHSVLSNKEVPATFAVGGVGGISATAMPGPTEVDVDDEQGNGYAFFNGRLINPPFVFGSGGVELVAKEMTTDLQALKASARENPGTPVALRTHGTSFGTITYDSFTSSFDTSGVEGIDADLVVRPFGRKGNNLSVRQFALGAFQFHMGLQPTEIVGEGFDDDDDGVVDEVLPGELSALHVFCVASEAPTEEGGNRRQTNRGYQVFENVGCADCHTPATETRSARLPVAYPEVDTNPRANVFMNVNLRGQSAGFRAAGSGILVPMYSDLKRHDMGASLAEHTGDPLDAYFITPRLWGIADTAPYMHDGRALTLSEAIEMHGGEGRSAANRFAALAEARKIDLLAFLDTLRTPVDPNRDLDGPRRDN